MELADTRDLGSRGASLAGSTPVTPTIFMKSTILKRRPVELRQPKPDKKGDSYSYYSVRRKDELYTTQLVATENPDDPFLVNFLKHNPQWERCKITISKA